MKQALTATAVKSFKPATKAYKKTDGGGMYLRVLPSGARSWRYKYVIGGKERVYTLGTYPEMTLLEAREAHREARVLVSKDVHPLDSRELAATNTFESVARVWMSKKALNWSDYYERQVKTVLETDVFPKIGSLNVRDVGAVHLRSILKAVEERTVARGKTKDRGRGATSIAVLIRQWCSAIFKFAAAQGFVDADPTVALHGTLIRPKVRHHNILVAKDIPEFLSKLAKFTGHRTTGIAIELLLLTFVRTGELRGAMWDEFDLPSRVWRIPAERMKTGKPHVVPLSQQALGLLEELHDISGQGAILFPNTRTPGEVMTMTTINRALERMGYGGKLSGHSFRGTASTVLHENGYDSAVIEKQLAHEDRNTVRASYNHSKYYAARGEMMQFWADFLFNLTNELDDNSPNISTDKTSMKTA